MRVALADPTPLFTIDEADARQLAESRGRASTKEGEGVTVNVTDNAAGINPLTQISSDAEARRQRVVESKQKKDQT